MEDSIVEGIPIEQKLLVIVLDCIIIAELFVGMFIASSDPDNLTVVFCKTFFSLLLPTLGAAFIANRRLKAHLGRQTARE